MTQQENQPKVAKKRGAGEKVPEADASNVVPIRGGAPVEVLGADETYANSVHITIQSLLRRYEETYFALAQKLYEVKEKKLYRVLDKKYETFKDYVESLGIEYRKSKYLVRLWWWYGIEQNADPKLLAGAHEIGWSKAKELVEVVDGRNAARWFKLAKEMNAIDLAQAARVAKRAAEEKAEARAKAKAKEEEKNKREGKPSTKEPDEHPEAMKVLDPKMPKIAQPFESDGGQLGDDLTEGIEIPDGIEDAIVAKHEEKKQWVKLDYSVHKDVYKTVQDAIMLAGELAESEHKGNILSLICLHYVSFYDAQKSVVIGEWLAQLERLTGLSMVAIDRRTDEIIYGSDLIDELAQKDGDDDDGVEGVGD